MLHRLLLVLVAGFWLVMNVLLWRAEFRGRQKTGGAVRVETVWHRILTAPDDSSLDIFRAGQKVGFCRWVANMGMEKLAGKTADEGDLPEELTSRFTSYNIEFDGNMLVSEITNRVRFNVHLTFATNNMWQSASLRLAARPWILSVGSQAATRTLDARLESDGVVFDRTFSFAQLARPESLLQEAYPGLIAPLLIARFGGLSSTPPLGRASAAPGSKASPGLDWTARHDWLTVGHTQVKVYRLEALLPGKNPVVLMVSRIGEILRAELPGGVVLVNDALANY